MACPRMSPGHHTNRARRLGGQSESNDYIRHQKLESRVHGLSSGRQHALDEGVGPMFGTGRMRL